MLAHTYRQRFNPTQGQPYIEGTRHRTGGILMKLESLVYCLVICHQRATNYIAMPIDIFRRAMQDDIGPQLKRLLEIGTTEGVIDDE